MKKDIKEAAELLSLIVVKAMGGTWDGKEYVDITLSRRDYKAAERLSKTLFAANAEASTSPPAGDAEALKIAMGYHLNADAYRDTFPDDAVDHALLQKSETYHRLQARTLISEKLAAECLQAMKEHAAKDPALVAQIEKIKQEWKS